MTEAYYLWPDILRDVYSGISKGIGHSTWYVENLIKLGWKVIISSSEIEVEHLDNGTTKSISFNKTKMKKQLDSLKVAGVGYSRTGTYSLALALNELDFPTIHTMHLFEKGEIFDHLVNSIFYESIKEDKIIMGVPDFDLLLRAGYTATMDLPFALYYNQILEQYPDCKFILTLREDSNVWFRSWNSLAETEGGTLFSKLQRYIGVFITHVKKIGYYKKWLYAVINEDRKFLSHEFPLPAQNRERAISSYEKHNQRIRDSIPPSQLLEYSVKEGWEPLCTFLEIPEAECPSSHGIPFPRSNSAHEVWWHAHSTCIVPMIFAMLILTPSFFLVFRKITTLSVVDWYRVQMAKFLRFANNLLEERKKEGHTKMD